jgi:hypothetical protein
MTVLCGACGAENRDAAKFCKGCGRKIAQAWPQPPAAAVGAGEAALLMGAAAAAPTATAAPAAPAAQARMPSWAVDELRPAPAPLRPRIGNGRWIVALGLLVGLLVLTAAWWGHRNRSLEIAKPAATQMEPQAAASAPALAPVLPPQTAQPAAGASPPPVIAEKVELAAPEPAAAAAVKPRKAPAKKQPPTPAAPVVEAALPAAPAPAPAPVRSPSPQESCGSLNFIAKAQCMATQCARPELAAHAQCEAVRRQQRLEEEKRNPTMAN